MKKVFAVQVVISALLIFPSASFAIEPSAMINRQERKVETRIASQEARKEKIASREAVFKEKIQKFRDKKKADAVTKINDRLNALNKRRVEEMTKHIDRMSEIIVKISSNSKVDVSKAQSALDIAKAAVATQSAQDYNIVVSTEAKVGQDAKVAKQKLEADLKATHQKVADARKALTSAIQTAMTGMGGSNGTK